MTKLLTMALLAFVCCLAAPQGEAQEMKVGLGRQVITPDTPIWMGGYASRKAPSEGKIHDLWAKAIAIEDQTGARAVIVTTDLLTMPAELAKAVAEKVNARFSIPRERIMLTASHTHCGPVIHDRLINMYGLDETQQQVVSQYADKLPDLLLAAIDQAVSSLAPGTLEWGRGEAGFASNRRSYTLGGIENAPNPIGVIDHDVPILLAKGADGTIKGILFGYACHNTTLSFQQLCGDYAGFAQADLEQRYPGATALFVAGCGGDQNPYPRGKLELAQQHGGSLAEAVRKAVGGTLTPVTGPLHASFAEIPLELSEPPTKEQLEEQTKSADVYIQRRANILLQKLEAQGSLDKTYPYPVQVWQFADTLQMTALGGEVVVDYSLRLKYDLGRDKHFVIAYANDVPAYIPSLRVLREGGYEGDTSMIYYCQHGPWAPTIEQSILAKVHELSGR